MPIEKKNFRLSPSALNLMKECPRCFWLTQHKVWKRPAGIFPSLPSGMDRILKNHFNKFRDADQLPPELCDNSECEGTNLFGENESEKELLKKWQNNRKGISWQDNKGNELHGAVDNLLVKDGKIIVLDYKTRGYPLKDETADHYQTQLDIYNFLFRKNGYKTEDFAFLLFYVPKEVLPTGEVVFYTSLIKMKVNIKNAEKVWERAIKLLEGDCPKETCEWCNNY